MPNVVEPKYANTTYEENDASNAKAVPFANTKSDVVAVWPVMVVKYANTETINIPV